MCYKKILDSSCLFGVHRLLGTIISNSNVDKFIIPTSMGNLFPQGIELLKLIFEEYLKKGITKYDLFDTFSEDKIYNIIKRQEEETYEIIRFLQEEDLVEVLDYNDYGSEYGTVYQNLLIENKKKNRDDISDYRDLIVTALAISNGIDLESNNILTKNILLDYFSRNSKAVLNENKLMAASIKRCGYKDFIMFLREPDADQNGIINKYVDKNFNTQKTTVSIGLDYALGCTSIGAVTSGLKALEEIKNNTKKIEQKKHIFVINVFQDSDSEAVNIIENLCHRMFG